MVCALVATFAAVAAADPLISVTAIGVPTGENLIVNPSFERGAGEWPDAWSWTSNQPTGVVRVWSDRALTGKRSAGVLNTTSAGSGYWLQEIPVQANTVYLLTARALIDDGKVLVRALGQDAAGASVGFDKRAYDQRRASHPLVPGFWKREWVQEMTRDEWAPVDLIFDTSVDRAPDSVVIHLGSYFTEGKCWFDDAYLGPGALTLAYAVSQAPLSRVRVLDAAGAVLADSGPLPAGTVEYEGNVAGLPLVGFHCVESAAPDGAVTRQWYPSAPEGEQ